jgi:hypothetical protein
MYPHVVTPELTSLASAGYSAAKVMAGGMAVCDINSATDRFSAVASTVADAESNCTKGCSFFGSVAVETAPWNRSASTIATTNRLDLKLTAIFSP